MNSKWFTTLLLLSLVLSRSDTAFAKDALNQVQITQGINQKRPIQTRQTIGRRYVWNFQNTPYTILMTIEVDRYNSYAGKERYDIPALVEEGVKTLANLTREFQRAIQAHPNWSMQDRIDYVLSFVQSLPYTFDDATTGYDEFRRYAVETLIEGGGDCEDTTILVGAILRGLGESVALIQTPGHIALGVSGNLAGRSFAYKGTKYYYCETTGNGWTVGEIPATVASTAVVTPLTGESLPPEPEPAVTSTPDTIRPTPQTAPITPHPPVAPLPEPQPASNEHKTVGTAIAIIFVVIGFGAPVLYLLYRFISMDEDDSDDTDNQDNSEDDDYSGTAQSSSILDE